jgi:peroxiredoxin
MAQLVELQKRADEFEELDAELIFVFREEKEGVDGLEKIRDKYKTKFTLALDLDKKSSGAYSPEQRTFDNYVVDKQGQIAAIIPGTLTKRATADALIKVLKVLRAKEGK